MAILRKSLVASVAGSMSLAMLTGCPATTPTGTGPSTTPASTTTASPTATPSGTTTASPGATPTPGATASAPATGAPSPTTSAPVPTGKTTIVSGTVYDDAGAPVDAATITVTSLDSSVPYKATATTSQGSWVVNSVPEGANVQITATRDGWTSRQRVGSFQTQANQKNIVDFGGAGSNTDTSGVAYFISKYPEIASVDPGYDSTGVDNTTVSYKLTLSEPLDSTNQNRFANAIRLIPANQYSTPDNDIVAGDTALASGAPNQGNAYTEAAGVYYYDLKDQKNVPYNAGAFSLNRPVDIDTSALTLTPAASLTAGYSATNPFGHNHPINGVLVNGGALSADAAPTTANGVTTANGLLNAPYDYAVKNGTEFLSDTNTRAAVTWDATGTVATLTFNAPLIADRTNQARYQVALVVTSTSDRIVDKDNNQLGLDDQNNQNTIATSNGPGELLHSTIKQPDLSLNLPTSASANSAVRWQATHQDAARFAVNVDNTDPKLVSLAYSKSVNNRSSRFELTFNEPVAAYNGRAGGHVGSNIANGTVLSTISFAVSDRTGGTANISLKGNTSSANYFLNPGSDAAVPTLFGTTSVDVEKEFFLTAPTSTVLPGTLTRMGNTGGVNGALLVGAALGAPNGGGGALFTYGTTIQTAEAAPGNGNYLLAVNSSNARTLFIYVVGRSSVFSQNIVELKARVEGVPDPAGNAIKSNDADNNQITTSVQAS